MTGIRYPVRAKIIDVDGQPFHNTGYNMATPEISRPHVGKLGTAYRMSDETVVVVLDDGTPLYGSECWWEPQA